MCSSEIVYLVAELLPICLINPFCKRRLTVCNVIFRDNFVTFSISVRFIYVKSFIALRTKNSRSERLYCSVRTLKMKDFKQSVKGMFVVQLRS